MHRRRFIQSTGILATLALIGAPRLRGESDLSNPSNIAMKITRNGSQPAISGPADWFTGKVRIDSMFQAEAPARVGGAIVAFGPGARTAWHTHPLGQTLIVTAGVGRVQRKGGPIEDIRPGDVV